MIDFSRYIYNFSSVHENYQSFCIFKVKVYRKKFDKIMNVYQFSWNHKNLEISRCRASDAKTMLSSSQPQDGVKKRFHNITKSKNDNRNYRGLWLSNNMKVLLISDPTDKSAASMDVNIGEFQIIENLKDEVFRKS